jgi:DNA-binding MarR family transcriptional regulator
MANGDEGDTDDADTAGGARADADAAAESLQRLGLSQYEAKVFIALTRLGSGTAREVDRMTDVPRSQVYGAADDLEERGLVDVQQSNPKQYRAVGLEEARETLRERFEAEQDRAFAFLEEARAGADHRDEHQEGVWTVHGRENVSGRVQQIVAAAEDRVIYGSSADLLDDGVAAALRERAGEAEVWVFSADGELEARFADSDVLVAPVPETMSGEKDSPGRLLAVDGETILLSVLGGEELPGVRKETAIWSSDTGFATVLLQLLGSHLGEPVDEKL